MNKIVNVKDIDRSTWLEYRRAGIGGSDAAVIVGLNPFKSLSELYADKKGLLPDKDDTEKMRIGRDLEEYVSKRFCEATGKKVRRNNFMCSKTGFPFLTANVDREIIGENAGLECKTTSNFSKNDFENGNIPLYYYCQCVHYMNVMEYDRMYLAVLVLGVGFYYYTIERNQNEIDALQTAEIAFWNDHIVPGIPPDGDGSESAEMATSVIFRKSDPEKEISIFDCEKYVHEYLELQTKIKELEKAANICKERIQSVLADATVGKTDRFTVTWRSCDTSRVDSKMLREKYPEIYAECLKTSSSRRFNVKEN